MTEKQETLWPKIRPETDPQPAQGYLCVGGPFPGSRLYLGSPKTLTIEVGLFRGHYEARGASDLIYWNEEESA